MDAGGLAPPPLWQRDIQSPTASGSGLRVAMLQPEALSEAQRHLRTVVAESRVRPDLYDQLAGTRREETYQPYFPGVSSSRNSARMQVLTARLALQPLFFS